METQGLMDALQQLCDFLGPLEMHFYTEAPPGRSSIGAHTRHCIEHVACLFGGLDGHLLDYDSRARDPMYEQQPLAAIEKLQAQIRLLGNIPSEKSAQKVRVRMMISSQPPVFTEVESFFGREVLFVMSHTIHHMALIRLLCPRDTVTALRPAFGVALSTQTYMKKINPKTIG